MFNYINIINYHFMYVFMYVVLSIDSGCPPWKGMYIYDDNFEF